MKINSKRNIIIGLLIAAVLLTAFVVSLVTESIKRRDVAEKLRPIVAQDLQHSIPLANKMRDMILNKKIAFEGKQNEISHSADGEWLTDEEVYILGRGYSNNIAVYKDKMSRCDGQRGSLMLSLKSGIDLDVIMKMLQYIMELDGLILSGLEIVEKIDNKYSFSELEVTPLPEYNKLDETAMGEVMTAITAARNLPGLRRRSKGPWR